jgi:hypothetical protein
LSFFGSLLGGSSPDLNAIIGQFKTTAGNQLTQGQKYSSTAGDFWSDIVSGDASKQAQALSPEISSAKKSSQEDTKTATEMGTRSGGTAASNAASKDKVHSYITNLIGSLTNSSATNLANLGTTETSTGLQSLSEEQNADAARMQNWSDSILGLGITKGAGFLEGFGLGKV